MKRNCLALLFSVWALSLFAQASFTEMSFNFGEIKEEKGKVTHKFEFTNKGKTPLLITDVKTSCGCTSSNWTKSPVPAGGKGFVTAEYDPNMRVGNFDKEVTVTFLDKSVIVLKISGDVIGRTRTIDDNYPIKIGNLRLADNKIPFAKIKSNVRREENLQIFNNSKEKIKITFKDVPAYMTLKSEPETLKPNQQGAIIVNYDATKRKEMGFKKDNIKVLINGKELDKNTVQVSATRVE